MTTETITIEINSKGARVVRREIDGVAQSSEKAQKSVSFLKKGLALLGGAATVRKLASYANEFTELQNRIRVVTKGTDQLNAVTDELFKISQRTRSSLSDNANLFSRLSLATGELGVSQREVLDFTESLNKAIVISGASAVEAKAGIVQLSQGLASGALRGDELRSVLEQLPVVADVIAKQLGVTRGELRELGKQGKITADAVLEAFKNADEELTKGFAKTVPTLPQAFIQLNNAITKYVGEIDTSKGVTGQFGKLIVVLANNFDTVARSAVAAGIAISAVFVKRGITAAIAGLKVLTIAIATNPIGAIVVAIGAATAALIAFSDRLKLSSDGLATVRDFFIASFNVISDRIDAFVTKFKTDFSGVATFLDNAFGGLTVGRIFNTFLIIAASAFDGVIAAARGTGAAAAEAFNNFPRLFKDIIIKAVNGGIGVFEDFVNTIKDLLSLVGLDLPDITFGRIENDAAGAGARVADAFKEEFNRSFSEGSARGVLSDITVEANKLADKRALEEKAAADRQKKALADLEKAKLKNVNTGKSLLEEELKLFDQEERLLSSSSRQREILSQVVEFENKLLEKGIDLKNQDVKANVKQFEQRAIEIQQLNDKAEALERINGTQQAQSVQANAVGGLLAAGDITTGQAALDTVSNPGLLDFEGTQTQLDAFVEQHSLAFQQIKELRDNQLIDDQTANQLRMKADIQLAEQRIANQRKLFGTLSSLANSENKKLAAIGKAAAVTQATIDGVLGVQKALASAPPPANFALAAAVGVTAAANVAQIVAQRRLGGDLNSGQLSRVGEGTRPEAFRSSITGEQFFIPPERGRVEPLPKLSQQNQANATTGQQGSNDQNVDPDSGQQTNVNILFDPEAMRAVTQSQGFTNDLLEIVELNQDEIRGKLGF